MMDAQLAEKRALFLEKMAHVLEVGAVTPETILGEGTMIWDSLNAIQTVIVIDECYRKDVPGHEVAECKTVADLMKLAEG